LTTNNTLCRTIVTYLSIEKKINWNQRIRCVSYILNLIIKAFLFVIKDEEQLIESYNKEDELEGEKPDDKRSKERATSIRNKMGVIGKIYNIVVYICASPNCTKGFEAMAKKLIPIGNCTKWNSWYYMLYIALETEVLNALWNYTEIYISNSTIDKKDELLLSNITFYYTIKQFLSIFESTTLFLEG
jgi:hypothetical protein